MSDMDINSSTDVQSTSSLDDTSTAITPTTTSTQQTDSISSAIITESDLNNPNSVFNRLQQPVLNAWSKIISLAMREAKNQILSDDILDIMTFKGFRQSAILTAEDLSALEAAIREIGDAYQSLYDEQNNSVDDANSSISDYNSDMTDQTEEDQDHIDAMNAATVAYNASDKGTDATTTYNNAINDYNTYVNTTRVTNYDNSKSTLATALNSYQTTQNSQNTSIDDINAQCLIAGIPSFPYRPNAPIIPTQKGMPNAPSTTNAVAIANATNPTVVGNIASPPTTPTTQDLLDQYVSPIASNVVTDMQASTAFIDQITRYRDYQRYYLGPLAGKISTLPNSYVDQTNQVFQSKSTTVGSGAGVSLSSIVSGLGSRNLNRLLSDGIASDAAIKENIALSEGTTDQVRLTNLSLLSKSALGSSLPAAGLVSDDLSSANPDSNTAKIALSLAFSIQIAALASTQDLQEAILKQLQASNPDADPAALAKVASELAAASNISFALFATTQLAQSLNLPELPGQVLSLIDTPATNLAVSSASNTTVGDVLSNPSSSAYLRADVANSLKGSVGDSSATDIANRLNLNDINSESDLQSSINKQLVQAGITQDQAITSSQRAAEFVRAEVKGSNILDTSISKDIVQRDYLTSQLQSANIDPNSLTAITDHVSQTSYVSRRELRDDLTNQLTGTGLALGDARDIATGIVSNNQSGNLAITPISDTQLAEKVSAQVTNLTSNDLGVSESQNVANLVVKNLFDEKNPTSITNIIRTNTEALNDQSDKVLADNMHLFLKPSYDLYAFNEKIMDPANSLYLSVWNGVMYSTKFKHTESIDIIV